MMTMITRTVPSKQGVARLAVDMGLILDVLRAVGVAQGTDGFHVVSVRRAYGRDL